MGIFRQQRIETVLIAVYGRIEPADVQRFQSLLLDGIPQFARKHRDILVRFPYSVGVGKTVMHEKAVRVRRQPVMEHNFRVVFDKMTEVFIISPVCRYSLCLSFRRKHHINVARLPTVAGVHRSVFFCRFHFQS